jgi:hypothetical protein
MDAAWGSYGDEAGLVPRMNDRDQELLEPVFSWLEQDEQRSLNAERFGNLTGVPPATVRDWGRQGAMPPEGVPALSWLLENGGPLATHYRLWLSRKSRLSR